MQTAVEWFWNEIAEVLPFTVDSTTAIKMYDKLQQAKEMEKHQIIDAAERWKGTNFAEKYYAETYGSKGSDAQRIYGKHQIQMLEISDEEIEEAIMYMDRIEGSIWKEGAKWYREQLKKK